MKNIYDFLAVHGIKYEKHEHPAVFTVKESEKYDLKFDCGKTKNLFLRNKKGDRHYLIVLESSKRADINKLSTLLSESRFSFASPERMNKYLGLTPGSVSPFGLINDILKEVTAVIDKDLLKHEKLGFHPNINTATLAITKDDFKKFLDSTGNKIVYLEI
jgi:Ala-tRNA(Pro) deacylase